MTTATMRSVSDHIVVKVEEPEDVSPGGIVLPDQSKEKPTRGRVIAVGSGQLLRDGSRAQMEVAEGDQIVFSAYAGTEVKVDGDELFILRESDVLLVM